MPTLDDEQDLTRKQRRERAREERKEAERAVAESTTQRTRLMQLGAVAVVVAAIVAIVLVATGGGKKAGIEHKTKTTGETKVVSEVRKLIDGIPQSGNAIGSPTASVTLQYFGDLECPVCQSFSLSALPTLIEKFVRAGKLRVEYRALETATREPETFRTQQIAALAAGKQSHMWDYIELFYKQQGQEGSGYVTEAYLRELAKQVPGLNETTWLAARQDPEFAASITTDAQAANNVGFNGTPSFLVGKTGGALKKLEYNSPADPAPFAAAIEKLVKA
jgi:protein-disulfide isomerase